MDEYTGKISRWNVEKGYGFIRRSGEKDIFIHISALGALPRPPQAGDLVHFKIMQDQQGRPKAIAARIDGLVTAQPRVRQQGNPRWHTGSGRLLNRIVGVVLIALLAGGYQLWQRFQGGDLGAVFSNTSSVVATDSDARLQRAFEQRQSDLQIEGSGVVARVLPDDTQGSQHQRFLLRLSSGQTLLVAHNIDLAPRLPNLRQGDRVDFYGEYEWNAKGGVMHWTHRDPRGHHANGWLRYQGKTYQ